MKNYGLDTFKKDLKWKKYPNLLFIQEKFGSSNGKANDQKNKIKQWQKILDGGEDVPESKDFPRSKIKLKQVKKFINWRIPKLSETLLQTENLYYIENSIDNQYSQALVHNEVINQQFNKSMNKQLIVDTAVSRFVKEGTILAKIEWEEKTKKQDSVIYDENNKPIVRDDGEFITTEEEITLKNRPIVKFIDIENFCNDGSFDIQDSMYCFHTYYMTLGELLNDHRYKNIDYLKKHIDDYTEDDFEEYQDDMWKRVKIVEFYGYFDINNDGVFSHIIFSYIGDDLIIRCQQNHFERYPFVVARYLFEHNSFYGTTDIELLEDGQAINSSMIRGILDSIGRNAVGQRGIRKGALDPNNLKHFKQGNDYEFNNSIDNIANAMYLHEYPQLTSTPFDVMNMFNFEGESLTGIKPFNGGISGDGLGNTATGVKGALDATTEREMSVLRRLLWFFKDIGTIIVELNTYLLKDEQIIDYVGEDMLQVYRTTNPQDLRIHLSTPAYNAFKSQSLSMLLQTNAANMQQEEAKLIRAKIVELYGMPSLAKNVLNTKPSEQELQMQQLQMEAVQLQNEKVKADIENIKARAGENQIDQRLKEAKARKLHSESDLKDLEFVEKETGTDVEKQKAIDESKKNNQQQTKKA